MSNSRLALFLLICAGLLAVSCDALPDREPDCVVFQCGYSWGLVGNNIWTCGEENPDEMVLEYIEFIESPFPSNNARGTFPCGTDLSEELGYPAEDSFASGARCEDVGISAERIGDESTVCGAEGDDDDSAR